MSQSEFKAMPDPKPGQIWRTKAGGLYEIKPHLPVLPFELVELVRDEHGFTIWRGGACPVPHTSRVEALFRGGDSTGNSACYLDWSHGRGAWDIVAYKVVETATEAPAAIGIDPGADGGDHSAIAFAYMAAGTKVPSSVVNAITILEAAAGHMRDRAATYDKPEGERSMAQTVAAFNAITGRELSESEGWLLMDLLKLTRLFARPGFHRDSAEDHVAYGALLAEARARETAESLLKN